MEKSKDKGWSWVVLFGVFVSASLSVGFHQSVGVFFVDWQEDFGISTQAVGWTSSVSMAGFAISGKTIHVQSRLRCVLPYKAKFVH